MNNGLTPASQRSPFDATTVSLVGMLICVFTTLGILMSASSDQTGATLAEVTSSFSGALRDHGRNDVAVIAAAFRRASLVSDDEHAGTPSVGTSAPRYIERNEHSIALSEEEGTGLYTSDKLLPTDVNGPMFSHLMTELQRYCRVSSAQEFGGQLALDLHSQVWQSEDSIRSAMEQILKTCAKSRTSIQQSPAEFEIIVWASTPATEALVAASVKALTLEQSTEKSLKSQSRPAIAISSSGRIWTRPQSPRPLATVVVRSATHTAPSH